jgi:hypothetical protein
MLTINVNPDHPLDALEACTALVRLLGEVVTIPREAESFTPAAQDAMSMIFAAVEDAQEALADLLADRLGQPAALPLILPAGPVVFQDDIGRLHRRAADQVTPVTLARAGAGAHMRETPAGPLPEPHPAAPRLTEPRPAADKRRRAA